MIEDFSADTDILFEDSQLSSCVRYDCRLFAAIVIFGFDETMVRSSA